jgi:predicted enzyme related to lactoylglutathione lyase
MSSPTHFEIYGPDPGALADFYRDLFGWEIEKMDGIGYWRVQTGATDASPLHGGLTYRAIPGLNGWLLFVNVPSLEETIALAQSRGGSIVRPRTAVPKTAWVAILADPANNCFGVWQADSTAFPPPHPD